MHIEISKEVEPIGQKGSDHSDWEALKCKESSSKEPEKSDDAPSTSKTPKKAGDNPLTSKESDSSSVSSLVEVTTPWTLSPVPKPRCFIPSPASLLGPSSDSSVEEIPIPRTLS